MNMTPEQAIDNLDKASSQVSGNRDVHLTLIESASVLRKVITHCREQGLIELIFEKDMPNDKKVSKKG